MRQTPELAATERMARIEQARNALLRQSGDAKPSWVEPWIERSWFRCLSQGLRPDDKVGFDVLSAQTVRQVSEANRQLVDAAKPVLAGLARALSETGYFAILTNKDGVVIDADGPIDRSDRRAALITRIGVDLSERSVGTTAISAALAERQPVWLHRGEHFHADTSVYSCAGAPLIGPDGELVGMLDLTGVQAVERPELRHLAAQSARSIENALTVSSGARPNGLLLRLNWSGQALGSDNDGLICLDTDGTVSGANPAARHMLSMLQASAYPYTLHANDLFALPHQMLFDAARVHATHLDVTLWSGLRLVATPQRMAASGQAPARPASAATTPAVPLKTLEDTLIRQAVEQARGNVAQAARALGISRATLYRKLSRKP